jgi:micrococcal nuclease
MLSRGGAPGFGAIALLLVGVALLVFDAGGGGPSGNADGAGPQEREAAGTITRVVDGDTVEVELASGSYDVRYIGIDTPESVTPGEPVECFGKRASAANARLVEGERVRLVFDSERRDRYGRLLAYVYAGEVFVNAELVRGGLARTLEIAPNTAHAGLFDRLEQGAANAGRGLWGACGT